MTEKMISLFLLISIGFALFSYYASSKGKGFNPASFFSFCLSFLFSAETVCLLIDYPSFHLHQPSMYKQLSEIEYRVSPKFFVSAVLPYHSNTAIWGNYPGKFGNTIIAGYVVSKEGGSVQIKNITDKYPKKQIDQCFLEKDKNDACQNFWKSQSIGISGPILGHAVPAQKPIYINGLLDKK